MIPGFSLRKWYLDCVTEDGTVWIGYHVRFRGWPFRFDYVAFHLDGGTRETTSLRSLPIPDVRDGAVSWSVPQLGIDALFCSSYQPVRRLLLGTRSGSLEWNCAAPVMTGVVRLPGREFCGLGYAECLEMTIEPWKLPIDELRWGRFCGTGESVVWIDWKGDHPLHLVVRGGELTGTGEISGSRIRLEGDDSLLIDEKRTLRRARLEESLRALGPARWLVPARFRQAVEEKRLGRGRLTSPRGTIDSGWVVHELVTFHRS